MPFFPKFTNNKRRSGNSEKQNFWGVSGHILEIVQRKCCCFLRAMLLGAESCCETSPPRPHGFMKVSRNFDQKSSNWFFLRFFFFSMMILWFSCNFAFFVDNLDNCISQALVLIIGIHTKNAAEWWGRELLACPSRLASRPHASRPLRAFLPDVFFVVVCFKFLLC